MRWLAIALVLTGCATAEEISREPVRFSAVYPVSWDDMANCLARSGAHRHRVTPLLNVRQRTAEVIFSSIEIDTVHFVWQVKGLDGDQVEVSLRRIKRVADLGGMEPEQRANAERCGGRV